MVISKRANSSKAVPLVHGHCWGLQPRIWNPIISILEEILRDIRVGEWDFSRNAFS